MTDVRSPGMAGAVALLLVLFAGTLFAWTPEFWGAAVLYIGLFALGLIWAGIAVASPIRWTATWLYIPLALLALWGPLQLVLSITVYRFETSKALLFWVMALAAFLLAAQTLQSRTVRDRFLLLLLLSGFAIVVVSIVQFITSPNQVFWLFESKFPALGPFNYKNQFAAYVELLIPIALSRMLAKNSNSIAWAFVAATMFAAVVMSASRSGTVLVASEIVVVLIAGWGRGLVSSRVAGLLFLQLTILVGACTAIVGWESLGQHFQDQTSANVREKLLLSSLHMIRDRPWTGWGLGTWTTVYPAYSLFDNSLFANAAHSDWAQWTSDAGIPFALLLLWFTVRAAILSWRWLWGIGVVFVMIHSAFDYPTREPVLGAILFALAGALVAAARDRQGPRTGSRRLEN